MHDHAPLPAQPNPWAGPPPLTSHDLCGRVIWRPLPPLPGAGSDTASDPMYLVDLGFGKETLFRSGPELAEAIRRGIVGEQCRIYHRTRATWVPITVHPEFRRITAEHAVPRPAGAPRRHWTFRPPEAGEAAPTPPASPPQEVMVLPPARSWRQSLGSAFRFWEKDRN